MLSLHTGFHPNLIPIKIYMTCKVDGYVFKRNQRKHTYEANKYHDIIGRYIHFKSGQLMKNITKNK